MSLDVSLISKEMRKPESSGIFIREEGCLFEISEEEWKKRNPGQIPVRLPYMEETNDVYYANITHNLIPMAKEAGIYEALWRPEEIGITKAKQLIEPLTKGLELLKSDPKRFESLNPDNGWGSYVGFVPWVGKYLSACVEYPEADVMTWR